MPDYIDCETDLSSFVHYRRAAHTYALCGCPPARDISTDAAKKREICGGCNAVRGGWAIAPTHTASAEIATLLSSLSVAHCDSWELIRSYRDDDAEPEFEWIIRFPLSRIKGCEIGLLNALRSMWDVYLEQIRSNLPPK